MVCAVFRVLRVLRVAPLAVHCIVLLVLLAAATTTSATPLPHQPLQDAHPEGLQGGLQEGLQEGLQGGLQGGLQEGLLEGLLAEPRGSGFGHNSFLDFARGYQRLGKKMILPLLVGILLKVASFVPLILGKLSLLALVSIVASKLALIISAIIGAKKLHTGGMPYSYGHHGDWEGAASSMSYATELAHQGMGHQGMGHQGMGHQGVGHLNHRRINPSAPGFGFANTIANTIAAHVGRSAGRSVGRSAGRGLQLDSPDSSTPPSEPTPLATPPVIQTTALAEPTPAPSSVRQQQSGDWTPVHSVVQPATDPATPATPAVEVESKSGQRQRRAVLSLDPRGRLQREAPVVERRRA